MLRFQMLLFPLLRRESQCPDYEIIQNIQNKLYFYRLSEVERNSRRRQLQQVLQVTNSLTSYSPSGFRRYTNNLLAALEAVFFTDDVSPWPVLRVTCTRGVSDESERLILESYPSDLY